MEIINLRCPSCNAHLEVNSKLENATCNFCGSTFQVKNESKIERALKAFDEHLERSNNIMNDNIQRRNELNAEQWKQISENKWFYIMIFGSFLLLYLFIFLMGLN